MCSSRVATCPSTTPRRAAPSPGLPRAEASPRYVRTTRMDRRRSRRLPAHVPTCSSPCIATRSLLRRPSRWHPLGGMNLHASLLPQHRGPVPTIWALAEAQDSFGVTVHRLAARIDGGEVLAQRAIALPPGVTASAAARILHLAGVPLLEQAIADLAAGVAPGRSDPLLPYLLPVSARRAAACVSRSGTTPRRPGGSGSRAQAADSAARGHAPCRAGGLPRSIPRDRVRVLLAPLSAAWHGQA
jgi:hypothetical protein